MSGNIFARGAGSTINTLTTNYIRNNGDTSLGGNVIAPNITSSRIYSPNRVYFMALGDDGYIRVYKSDNDAAVFYIVRATQ